MCYVISSTQQSYESEMISFSQLRNLRTRGLNLAIQGHASSMWLTQNLNPGISDSKIPCTYYTLFQIHDYMRSHLDFIVQYTVVPDILLSGPSK